MNRLFHLAMILALTASVVAAEPPPATSPGSDLQSAIADLAAEDPVVRREAEQLLRDAGRDARPVLLAAAESADPAIAHAARQLLLTIPWFVPTDPPEIRRLLEGYGAKEPDIRREVVSQLANQFGAQATPVLLRILTEDPSNAVRWQVVAALQGNRRLIDPDFLKQLDENSDNAPVLAARAVAIANENPEDPSAVIPHYSRIIALESKHPTDDYGALQPIFDHLLGYYIVHQQFDHAADLYRSAIFRTRAMDPDGLNRPVLRLFALHAAFGPLKGVQADVRDHLPLLDPPMQPHVLAQVAAGSGNPIAAIPFRALGHEQVSAADQPVILADWLSIAGWPDAAERQFRHLLRQPRPLDQRIDIHLRLAHFRGQAGDDAAAAAHLQTVLRLLDGFEGVLVVRNEQRAAVEWLREQLNWRRLRDARARDDGPAAEKAVEALLNHPIVDADILADLLPALKDLDRAAEGDRLADNAYQQLKPHLDADPEDAHTLNNIAWLLARTNRRLDEALKFATWANTASPFNSAFIDTLAEVHYMRGDADKSVELEQKALLLNPGDPFMTSQLKKYRAAAGMD